MSSYGFWYIEIPFNPWNTWPIKAETFHLHMKVFSPVFVITVLVILCKMTLCSSVGFYQPSAKHIFHFRVDEVAWYPYTLIVGTMVSEQAISTLLDTLCCVYLEAGEAFGTLSSHNLGLTLILLMWRIWWAPNNANKWQMGFNSTFKALNVFWELCQTAYFTYIHIYIYIYILPSSGSIK